MRCQNLIHNFKDNYIMKNLIRNLFLTVALMSSTFASAESSHYAQAESAIRGAINYMKPRSHEILKSEDSSDWWARNAVNTANSVYHFFGGNTRQYNEIRLGSKLYYGTRSAARSVVGFYSPIYFALRSYLNPETKTPSHTRNRSDVCFGSNRCQQCCCKTDQTARIF